MRYVTLFLISILLPLSSFSAPIRIKDIVNIEGVRGNDLVGYGLVVGLSGSGDSLRNSPFTEEIMANLLERLGINIAGENTRPKNVAAVIVTASLPPFSRNGSQIDVNVAAIGDAKSLLGGTLVMTPLNAADGEVYAVAQGAVLSGGAEATGEAASVVLGVPTTGTIPLGARVEREVGFSFSEMKTIKLALRSPDFTTAARIEAAINNDFNAGLATLIDSGTVVVELSQLGSVNPARLIGRIESIKVEPEAIARVVVDHKSGTIVLGDDVRISRVAISQGNLSLRVRESPLTSQPNPFAFGETIVQPRTEAEIAHEPGTGLAEVRGEASLSEVVAGLNSLGVKPRDLIDILKSIHAAGALHADFIVN